MKLLLDMNLSPAFVPFLQKEGYKVIHWVQVGKPDSPDVEILEYAKQNDLIVLTHDLYFGAILAATQSVSPSVLQIRIQDISPEKSLSLLLGALVEFKELLLKGALVSIKEATSRARIFPLNRE